MVDAYSNSALCGHLTNLAASDSINGDLVIPSEKLMEVEEKKSTWGGRIWKVITFPATVVEFFIGGTLIIIMLIEMIVRRVFWGNEPHPEEVYNETAKTFLGFTPKFD